MVRIIPLLAAAFAAGIWTGGVYTWPRELVYILLLAVFGVLIWCVYKKCAKTIYITIVLLFVIGMLRYIQASSLSSVDISYYSEKTLAAYGILSEVPESKQVDDKDIQIKYVVDVQAIELEGNLTPAAGRMLVYFRQPKTDTIFHYGDKVKNYGEVCLLHNYNNPGLVDASAVLKRQGITARMKGAAVQRIEAAKDENFQSTLAVWRDKLKNIVLSVMPQSDAAVFMGMLFGGYSGIPPEVVSDFTATGIVHILSVSGSHIALLTGVMLWLGERLKVNCFTKVLLAMATVGFYAVFAGLSPPVVRSLVMGLVCLSASLFGREKDAISALSLAAFFMLVIEPRLIYDISFELSFGATVGLVFLYRKTKDFLSMLPELVSGALAVTIAAELGVVPFAAWYFSSFSLVSLAANLLIVPIIDFVMVLGILGLLVVLAVPFAGKLILIFCSLLIGLTVKGIAFLAAVPGAVCYLPAFNLWGGLVYYIVLAWLYGYLPKRIFSLHELWQKWPKQVALSAFLTSVLLIMYVWHPRPVSVHFIDVGQGDAALVVTPHGRAIVIDTGGTMGENEFDIGQRVVLPYLKHYGILRVDYMFLTHAHQDHAGGAAAIAQAMPVKYICMPQDEKQSLAIERLKHSKNYKPILPIYEGLRFVVDGVIVDVLHAGKGAGQTGNETSALLKVSYGNKSFLFTGDLTSQEEQLVLHKNLKSTVLKVAHHGAKTSSQPRFLAKVLPRYAVISVGYGNRFGHPHREILKQLDELKTETYRTDETGAVVFKTDGGNIVVESYK